VLVVHICNPSYREAENGRTAVRSQLRQIVQETPSPKLPEKKTGGVAQAVEHMLCECKTLSSNPTSTKKKKKSCICPDATFSPNIFRLWVVWIWNPHIQSTSCIPIEKAKYGELESFGKIPIIQWQQLFFKDFSIINLK
jgi:hypothetical protein